MSEWRGVIGVTRLESEWWNEVNEDRGVEQLTKKVEAERGETLE